jgi:hypothetical protein
MRRDSGGVGYLPKPRESHLTCLAAAHNLVSEQNESLQPKCNYMHGKCWGSGACSCAETVHNVLEDISAIKCSLVLGNRDYGSRRYAAPTTLLASSRERWH